MDGNSASRLCPLGASNQIYRMSGVRQNFAANALQTYSTKKSAMTNDETSFSTSSGVVLVYNSGRL